MAKQGSANALNLMKGISSFITFNNASQGTLGENVFPQGLPLYNSETGVVYIADGKTPLKSLKPRIDQVLADAEKKALAAAFQGGSYAAAANGVVVHGTDGKIDDASFKFIDQGKVKQAYLSDFLDESKKIKLEALPESVKAGFSFFENYGGLQSATPEQKKGFCFVADASGDNTVGSGWALYIWDTNKSKWIKTAEGEGLDVTSDMFVTAENVAKVGAVMYDHPIFLKAPAAIELADLLSSIVPPVLAGGNAIQGAAQSEQALGVTFSGQRKAPFTVKITPSKCSLKGFATAPQTADDDVAKEFTGTIEQVNTEIKNAKVVVGSQAGTVKVEYEGQSKIINVTVAGA